MCQARLVHFAARCSPVRGCLCQRPGPVHAAQGVLQTGVDLLRAMGCSCSIPGGVGQVHSESAGGVGGILAASNSLCDMLWACGHHFVRLRGIQRLSSEHLLPRRAILRACRFRPQSHRSGAHLFPPVCLRMLRFIVSFWPIWGFLTFPIVFVLFMGMLHFAHFVPL